MIRFLPLYLIFWFQLIQLKLWSFYLMVCNKSLRVEIQYLNLWLYDTTFSFILYFFLHRRYNLKRKLFLLHVNLKKKSMYDIILEIKQLVKRSLRLKLSSAWFIFINTTFHLLLGVIENKWHRFIYERSEIIIILLFNINIEVTIIRACWNFYVLWNRPDLLHFPFFFFLNQIQIKLRITKCHWMLSTTVFNMT